VSTPDSSFQDNTISESPLSPKFDASTGPFYPALTTSTSEKKSRQRADQPFGSETKSLWPRCYYTVDVIRGLMGMDQLKGGKNKRAMARKASFEVVFPGPRFISSTFNTTHDIFEDFSDSDILIHYMQLGHCEEGLWKNFLKECRKSHCT
jgi:hypothetical protein